MDRTTFVCPRELDIAHAADVRARLLDIPPRGSVLIDPSPVARVDGAGVQLLLAFVRSLEADGRSFSWSARSEPLCSAADNLGLLEALGLDGKE